jgi:subtilisin family serine protease
MVARADDALGIVGIAPGASLIALRACREDEGAIAQCDSFSVAKAFQAAILQRVQVVNLSLSGPPDRLLERLLAAARAEGIVVVAALDPAAADGGFPASSAQVLAVGAMEEEAAGSGGALRLLAPGREVPTTVPGGRWDFLTGSSFAAAHVSGLVALVLQLAPSLAPSQVLAALQSRSRQEVSAAPAKTIVIDACSVIARVATGWQGCRAPPPIARRS